MQDVREILNAMLDKDNFSRWMGIVVDEYSTGYCKLHSTITDDMLNGFGIVHGGILFSASDSAFAFACNSHGILTVALDANISFVRSAKAGETISVVATEIHSGNKTGFYNITTTNEKGEIVAFFKGTAYRTSKSIP